MHILETYQGRQWAFGRFTVGKWTLLITSFFLPSNQILAGIIIGFYLLEGLWSVLELRKGWKLPTLHIRVVGIWLITLVLLSLGFMLPVTLPLKLLIVDKLVSISIAGCIFFSGIVFMAHKKRLMTLARRKIAQHKNLVVIGVTGSYGKTSTKEFIAQIVGTKYKTVKTLASQNADIGIAERILKADLSGCEIFVCEMAAYHPGEIASSCSLFGNKIKVAVVTGINEQHQSLFGSIETTMKSKYELVEAVPEGGSALFNGENQLCRQMSSWNHNKKVAKIIINKTHIHKLPAHIPGQHFKENVALACAAGQAVGMTHKETTKAIESIVLPPRTMNVVESGSTQFIDDTFNANPQAVYAALEYMKKQKGKKVLVLQPLIELGSYAYEVHEKIGKIAAEICDQVILTNRNFNKPFLAGAASVDGGLKKVYVAEKPMKIKEGVILFEGKEAEKYLKGFS